MSLTDRMQTIRNLLSSAFGQADILHSMCADNPGKSIAALGLMVKIREADAQVGLVEAKLGREVRG